MKKSFIPVMICTLVFFSTESQALNCKDPQNGFERSQCIGQEQVSADTELNKVYKELMKYTNNKKELVTSELAWIKFRDSEAKFQSLSYKGGTEENREYSSWLTKLTRERIQHLKMALNKLG